MSGYRMRCIRFVLFMLAAIGGCYCNSYALHSKARNNKPSELISFLRSPMEQQQKRTIKIIRNNTNDHHKQKTPSPLPATKAKDDPLTKLDYTVFVTYFCNIICLTLSVVTVPAMAREYNLSPKATTAFCASIASVVPLGGAVGKVINGFVCQYLGGRKSSVTYLLGVAVLQLALSVSGSLAPIAMLLIGVEFLSSIQWTSICAVMGEQYFRNQKRLARGITILSISSTLGALFAKTAGAALLQLTDWRTVCRFGSLIAASGATAMYLGGKDRSANTTTQRKDNGLQAATMVKPGGQQIQNPLMALKSVFQSPIFWMTGIGHSLGFLTRSIDRLLGPFLQDVGGISSTMAAGLTSSVTIGFVVGLLQGKSFANLDSIPRKISMIRRNYAISVSSAMALAACAIPMVQDLLGGNTTVGAITLISGIMASFVSFQFYNFANLMSTTMFPENNSVALSLTDAVGFTATAGFLGVSKRLLGNFGWVACWISMAMAHLIGGTLMTRAIETILVQQERNKR